MFSRWVSLHFSDLKCHKDVMRDEDLANMPSGRHLSHNQAQYYLETVFAPVFEVRETYTSWLMNVIGSRARLEGRK